MIYAFCLFVTPVHPITGLWTSYLILAATIVGALVAGRMRHYFLMYAFGATGLLYSAVLTHNVELSFVRENQQPPSLQNKPEGRLVAGITSHPFRPARPAEKVDTPRKIKPAPKPIKKSRVVKPRPVKKPAPVEKKKVLRSTLASRYGYVGTFHDGLAPVKGKNGKWGYIDRSDRQVVPCFLEMACTFHAGLGGVMNAKGKWGFVNRQGDLIIPYIYDQALAFEEHNEQAMINMDGQWYWINREGTVLRDATLGDLRARRRI